MLYRWGLGLCLVAGSAWADAPRLGETSDQQQDDEGRGLSDIDRTGPQGIVNGHETTEFPGVVALGFMSSGNGGGIFCSGTLISESWVVTAAHCLSDIQGYKNAGYTPVVVFGGNLYGGYDDMIEFTRWIQHPSYGSSGGQLRHDIGLVELAHPKTDVAAVPVNETTPSWVWEGTELTYVGFGITGDGRQDSGVKRTADIDYYQFDSQFVYALERESNLCSGDSGGASLRDVGGQLVLVGVNSFVFGYYEDANCEGGGSGATRLDQNLDFLRSHTDVTVLGEETDTDTDADTDSDTDTDVDTDTDTDTDVDTDTDTDTDAEQPDDWEEPERPDEVNIQAGGCSCGTVMPMSLSPVGSGLMLLWLVGRRRIG
jgi:hypothetical protein